MVQHLKLHGFVFWNSSLKGTTISVGLKFVILLLVSADVHTVEQILGMTWNICPTIATGS